MTETGTTQQVQIQSPWYSQTQAAVHTGVSQGSLNASDEWKEEVIAQARMFVRLANRPPFRVIGDDTQPEPASPEEEEEQPSAQEPSEHVKAQVA